MSAEAEAVGLGNCSALTQCYSINTNVSKMAFWILSYLAFEPHLVSQVRAEVASVFTADGQVDADYVVRRCPQLNAIWLETLRLTSASTALRTLTDDTWLGGKHLARGNLLLMSARQLHFDTAAFGANIDAFRPARFVEDPRLHRSPGFRPFGECCQTKRLALRLTQRRGGGTTLCPGRYLAKHMVLIFVAEVLHRYEVRLAVPQTMPRYQEDQPTIGILNSDEDLLIELKRRSNRPGIKAQHYNSNC